MHSLERVRIPAGASAMCWSNLSTTMWDLNPRVKPLSTPQYDATGCGFKSHESPRQRVSIIHIYKSVSEASSSRVQIPAGSEPSV